MNTQMTDLALAEIDDILHDDGIEALAIRPSRGEYRRSLVINENEIKTAEKIIEENGLPLIVKQIGGRLASIEPLIW